MWRIHISQTDFLPQHQIIIIILNASTSISITKRSSFEFKLNIATFVLVKKNKRKFVAFNSSIILIIIFKMTRTENSENTIGS